MYIYSSPPRESRSNIMLRDSSFLPQRPFAQESPELHANGLPIAPHTTPHNINPTSTPHNDPATGLHPRPSILTTLQRSLDRPLELSKLVSEDTNLEPMEANMSSQTVPESPQWRVSTQHLQSSLTEPESSQWRIHTFDQAQSSQTEPESSQWRIKTQSSMTEPESSQWRVPTQRTPKRHKPRQTGFGPSSEGCEEGVISQGHWSNSLPIASYEEDSQGMDEPNARSIAILPPSPLRTVDLSQHDDLTTDALQRRLAGVRVAYTRKRAAWLEGVDKEGHADDLEQQSLISDMPLSIPSDFTDSYPESAA